MRNTQQAKAGVAPLAVGLSVVAGCGGGDGARAGTSKSLGNCITHWNQAPPKMQAEFAREVLPEKALMMDAAALRATGASAQLAADACVLIGLASPAVSYVYIEHDWGPIGTTVTERLRVKSANKPNVSVDKRGTLTAIR